MKRSAREDKRNWLEKRTAAAENATESGRNKEPIQYYQVDNWRKAETRNRVSGTNRGCLGLKHEKDSAEIVGAI